MSSPGKSIDSLSYAQSVRAKRLHGSGGASQGRQEQPVIASLNVAGAMPIVPSFTVHLPESDSGADGPIAFADKKIDQLFDYTFAVSGAEREEQGNVDHATISRGDP